MSADIYLSQGSQRSGGYQTFAYWHVIKGDVGDVVVRAALPRVVQAEAKSAGVPPVESDEFAESAVLDVDRPVIDLHSTNGEIPAGQTAVTSVKWFTLIK